MSGKFGFIQIQTPKKTCDNFKELSSSSIAEALGWVFKSAMFINDIDVEVHRIAHT